jgi:hypothetical protein
LLDEPADRLGACWQIIFFPAPIVNSIKQLIMTADANSYAPARSRTPALFG